MPTFPLDFMPDTDYHVGGVRFGDDRGSMLHPACDLIAAPGTKIYAVEAGVVRPIFTKMAKAFFESGPHVWDPDTGKSVCAPGKECLMVYELQIQHGSFLARYGEIAAKLAPGIGPGVEVKEGQHIAFVGQQSVANMLHFEMFSNANDTTDLLAMGNMRYTNLPKPPKTYNRRSDLMDPTAYLDGCTIPGSTPPKHHVTEHRDW
jgi:murein DD-endopeptidase MepM/ murein hydrolase activator NlpD